MSHGLREGGTIKSVKVESPPQGRFPGVFQTLWWGASKGPVRPLFRVRVATVMKGEAESSRVANRGLECALPWRFNA